MRGWGRQHWMVAALGVLLVYLLWSRLIAPNLGGDDQVARSGGSQNFDVEEMVELRADLLEPQTAVYKRSRNIFNYRQGRQPKPKATPPLPEPEPQTQVQPAADRKPPAPKPPNFAMLYLGSFGHRDAPIAVFTEGEDLYNLRVGDVVQEEFVLVRVGIESADVGFVNFPNAEPKRIAIKGS